MKKNIIPALFAVFVVLFAGCAGSGSEQQQPEGDTPSKTASNKTEAPKETTALSSLAIGAAPPLADEKMANVMQHNEMSINDAKGENGLLVMFSCNTCPYVLAWEGRYAEVSKMCEKSGVGVILVNSNEAKRSDDDSKEAMMQHAKEKSYGSPYVIDVNSKLADAFGASKTPDVFLFDKNMKLVYKGAIDDNHKNPGDVKEHYLKSAIKNMIDGKPVSPNTTKSIGCSIKRIKA